MDKETLLQAIARGWCAKANASKEMDVDLGVAIGEEVWPLFLTAEQKAATLRAEVERLRKYLNAFLHPTAFECRGYPTREEYELRDEAREYMAALTGGGRVAFGVTAAGEYRCSVTTMEVWLRDLALATGRGEGMLKQLKPGHYYLIVNVDEPYAEDVFEVIKHGQMRKEQDGENAWPEGDIDYATLIRQTWPTDQGAQSAAAGPRFFYSDRRDEYRLVATLQSRAIAAEQKCGELERERDSLKRQVDTFRDGLQKARDLYREKSGNPDRFVGDDWWEQPDDQCVVLWLIEWAEDVQNGVIVAVSAERDTARAAAAGLRAALERVRDEAGQPWNPDTLAEYRDLRWPTYRAVVDALERKEAPDALSQ